MRAWCGGRKAREFVLHADFKKGSGAWRLHFRRRVTRSTFAAATAPTFAAAAAFGARHWPSPAPLLCFTFVLPAAALPHHMLLHSFNAHECRQQQRHMQLLAAVTCNIRSRAAVTTCNSPSAAPRMHARRRFKWGTVQAVSQGLSAGVGVHTRQAGEVRHGVQLFVLWCMRGKLKRGAVPLKS